MSGALEEEPKKIPVEQLDDEKRPGVRGLNRRMIVGGAAVALGVFVLAVVFSSSSTDSVDDAYSLEEEAFSEVVAGSRGIDAAEQEAARQAMEKENEEKRAMRDRLNRLNHLNMPDEQAFAGVSGLESEEIRLLRAALHQQQVAADNKSLKEDVNDPWLRAREEARSRSAQAYHQDAFAASRSTMFAQVSKPGNESALNTLAGEPVGGGEDIRRMQREMLSNAIAQSKTAQTGSNHQMLAFDGRLHRAEEHSGHQIYRGNPVSSSNPNQLVEAAPNTAQAGTVIRLVLETGVNSDLPGMVKARVQSPVYDTVTGRVVLIPSGAFLLGDYQSQIGYGQERVAVAWQRLILPNGKSLELGGLSGTDLAGQSGLADQVDNHWGRILAAAGLSSVLASSAAVAAGPQNVLEQSPEQAVLRGFGQDVARHGTSIVERQLNVAPTIRIRPGTQIAAVLHQDLRMEPYE